MFGELYDSLGGRFLLRHILMTIVPVWTLGNTLCYENNGDDREIAKVTPKTYRDESGSHPDAAWIINSSGPDRTRQGVNDEPLGLLNRR